MKKITKDMTIAKVVEDFPEVSPMLTESGFHCACCPAAQSETIEDLANNNQMDVDKFLESLNKAIES